MEVAPNNSAIAPVILEATPEGRVVVDSLVDAQTWTERLELDLKDIDWQLARPTRGHPTESREMTADELAAWRSRAQRARLFKEREIVELRRFIREGLLALRPERRLLETALRLIRQSVDLDPDPDAQAWEAEVAAYLGEAA